MPVQIAWFLAAGYAILLSAIYWFRYKKGRWKNIILVPENEKAIVEEDTPLILDENENIENSENNEEEDLF